MRWFFLAALLGLGCGDKGGDDTGASGDAGGDGGGDAGGDGGAGGATCGDLTGIDGVGTAWTYSFDDGNTSGTIHTEVTALDAATGDVVLVSTYEGSGSGYDYSSESTGNYRCDADGFWILDQDTSYTVTTTSGTTEGWSTVTYDEPVLLVPNSVAVGDTWTTEATGTVETSTGQTIDLATTTDYEVVAEESVTVPAGTWDAYRIDITADAGTGATTTTTWIAPGVGTVKTDSTELTAYSSR